jgi:predicted nucleic acid-binding protein
MSSRIAALSENLSQCSLCRSLETRYFYLVFRLSARWGIRAAVGQGGLASLLSLASAMVNMIPAIRDRGRILESLGFKPNDALHVAAAEQGQAEVLVTCDDGLLKTVQRHADILQVKVMSILRFIAEEI